MCGCLTRNFAPLGDEFYPHEIRLCCANDCEKKSQDKEKKINW